MSARPAPRRPTHLLLVAVLLGASLAGCIGADPSSDAIDTASSDARALQAPDPSVGDWWTIEIDDTVTEATHEATIVVTDRDEDTATIGVSEASFLHAFMILHLPPLGVVDLDEISWNVMWERFEPVSFPLEAGQSWTTEFHGAELDAEVTRVADGQAEIEMLGANERIELVYDAEVGFLTELRTDAYGVHFTLVDHGEGFEGTVERFSDVQLGFFEGRLANVVDAGLEPAGPLATVPVEAEVSHGTLALMVASVATESAPGAYRAAASAPDGTTFEHTFAPTPGGPGFLMELFDHEAVSGDWELEFQSAGPGFLGAELIVYDREQVTLGPRSGS